MKWALFFVLHTQIRAFSNLSRILPRLYCHLLTFEKEKNRDTLSKKQKTRPSSLQFQLIPEPSLVQSPQFIQMSPNLISSHFIQRLGLIQPSLIYRAFPVKSLFSSFRNRVWFSAFTALSESRPTSISSQFIQSVNHLRLLWCLHHSAFNFNYLCCFLLPTHLYHRTEGPLPEVLHLTLSLNLNHGSLILQSLVCPDARPRWLGATGVSLGITRSSCPHPLEAHKPLNMVYTHPSNAFSCQHATAGSPSPPSPHLLLSQNIPRNGKDAPTQPKYFFHLLHPLRRSPLTLQRWRQTQSPMLAARIYNCRSPVS